MVFIGTVENGLTLPVDEVAVACVSHCWGYQSDAGVVMLIVVPPEKLVAMMVGLAYRVETVRPISPIFQGFETGFSVGVVVRHSRSRKRTPDPEIVVKVGDCCGCHLCAPVGMDNKLIPVNILAGCCHRDQTFSDSSCFALVYGPADCHAGP